MKKQLLSFSFLLMGITLYSQVTITDSDFPVAGDTAMVSVSTQYNDVDITTTGADQTWDFSFLAANSQRIDTFFTVPNILSTYGAIFNNIFTPAYLADYNEKMINNNLPSVPGLSIEKVVSFTKKSSSAMEVVGIGMEVNGIQVPFKSDTIDTLYQLPMTMADNWTSRSYTLMDFSVVIDIMLKRNQKRVSVVDGWGEMITPFGTFDVVRVKSIITYTDSFSTTLFGQSGAWTALPLPEDTEYTWWSNSNKIPIVKIIARGGIPTVIEYKDREVVIGASVDEYDALKFGIYPNPTTDQVSISIQDFKESTLQIVDINGKTMYTNSNVKQINVVEVADWPKGVYIVNYITAITVKSNSLVIK